MTDVAVLGGGLAGLSASALLARAGHDVCLFEQGDYPRHRVCGEYVSAEVEPFLSRLGVDLPGLDAKRLCVFELSSRSGRRFSCAMPSGGWGSSRYALDTELCAVAQRQGVNVRTRCSVEAVEPAEKDRFRIVTSEGCFNTRVVIGSFGKRGRLDRRLGRAHVSRRSPYVGVKRHFQGPFPQDRVSLHSIPGGYCGISPVEGDRVNVCYLTHAATLKAGGSVRGFERTALRSNPVVRDYLDGLTPAFDPPLVISQLDFGDKSPVHGHVLMLGDSAALIHPLCGNGMAMAMRAAHLLAPRVTAFLTGKISREQMERAYTRDFQSSFHQRRLSGRLLQPLLESRLLNEGLCAAAGQLPWLTRRVIQSTHGEAF